MRREYGIDVSYHQGVIDWTAVKSAGVNYVILRAGYGFNTVDTQFVNNITGAIDAGIENIGIYWFSYAHDTNDIQTEVLSCINTIEPYRNNINLPVWFDWEEASYSYVQRTYGVNLTNKNIQDMAREWCGRVKDAGYSTGIYSNKNNASNWFNMNNGLYLWHELNVQFWYARYGANDEKNLFIIPNYESVALTEHPETNILQYSDVGVISGINSNSVDLNVIYVYEPEPEPEPEPDQTYTLIETNNIDYVELRDTNWSLLSIVDTASSIIWHSTYYDVGDFEIYIDATTDNINMFSIGNYISRPNNVEIGIIESLEIVDDITKGQMLTVSGRFIKSILDRRHIYNINGNRNNATILRGNVENAIRTVITNNAINCTFNNKRNISNLKLGPSAGINKIIVNENGDAAQKQVSYDNLLTYTDEVLREYEIGSRIVYDNTNNKFAYLLYDGTDRSITNTDGNNPIIFSKEYDNLQNSVYTYDTTPKKTTALIGGEGEGLDRIYTIYNDSSSGLERLETFVDAGSVNQKYEDENGNEQTYTTNEYVSMLQNEGKTNVNQLKSIEKFDGTIDITNGNYIYNRDFNIGDVVTIYNYDLNKNVNVRIIEITECQDENGYIVNAEYEIKE